MLDALLQRFSQGDRIALSRLLTFVARGEHVTDILPRLPPAAKPSRVVAVTGSGGVGKSSLVGKLLETIRAQGQSVAVLACDPQSPVSGGALLGDRFRMPSRPDDDGVFIRSLAAISGDSALARHLGAMVRLLESFGFDVILIETVGAGQGDTAVRELADVVVLLIQPESGDDLQWEKAGLLEVADVIVIHKADLPGAEQVEAQVRNSLSLSGNPKIPVLRASAARGQGVEDLWNVVAGLPLRRAAGSNGSEELIRQAQETLAERFARALRAPDNGVRQTVQEWGQGKLGTESAAARLLRQLAE
jgi:LAO/AO transport system ATPase